MMMMICWNWAGNAEGMFLGEAEHTKSIAKRDVLISCLAFACGCVQRRRDDRGRDSNHSR